ncbi:MAG TPA: isoprenylcysteine carboxylmethyltransferase family protein [Caulobacteraceae bacterium]|jgi:protein-S-isoprenylcysteine O-methyltransferase Ste14
MNLTAKLLLILIPAALYVGLAIVGFGGAHAFFAHPPLTALVVITGVAVVAALFTQGNLSGGEREDRENRWVLALFSIIGLVDAFVPAWTDRVGFLTFGGDAVRWTGVAIYAIGNLLRIWPVFVLGRRFSGLVAIQENHTLVTGGVYRFVRNPSYLGLLVTSIGWGVAFRSLLGVILALLTLIPLIARIRSEEALLATAFGDEYAAYRKRSWRLVPFVY